MKTSLQLFFLLLLLVFTISVSAQSPAPTPQKVEIIEPPDLNNYKDWKKVYFSEFSIYVPQYFQFEPILHFEGGYDKYQDNDFKITVNLNQHTPNLATRRVFKNSKETIVFIGNVFISIWSYELERGEFTYNQELIIYYKKEYKKHLYDVSASIDVSSKDKEKGKELAEKILRSIKIEPEPPIGEPPPIIRKPAKEIKEKTVKKGKT